MSYDGDYVARDARFFILRALTEEIDGQSNSVNLRRMLDAQGIRRDPDWIVTQINKLGELGAVTVTMARSEEHTSELQSLMRISYAVFCLKKKKQINITKHHNTANTKIH